MSRLKGATHHFEKHLTKSSAIGSLKAKLFTEKLLCFFIHFNLNNFILFPLY